MEKVTIQSTTGREVACEIAAPQGKDHPALIVVHEWWGVNDDIRRICNDFAREGFLALAIDLYEGVSTSDVQEAIQLVDKLKTSESMEKIEGAVKYLESDERTNGKIGVTGFCLGGAMALGAAINVPGLAAAVPFYGTPREEFAKFGDLKTPILGHYAKTDPFVRAERVEELRERAKAAGVPFDAYFYDAGHAFMRKGSPEYDEAAATVAWSRTITFLREHLATSAAR